MPFVTTDKGGSGRDWQVIDYSVTSGVAWQIIWRKSLHGIWRVGA
jgi:hypothetical protein